LLNHWVCGPDEFQLQSVVTQRTTCLSVLTPLPERKTLPGQHREARGEGVIMAAYLSELSLIYQFAPDFCG
jgi:hypothetical protein